MANAEIPGFNINSSGLRLIRGRYSEGHTSTRSRMPGLKEYLNAEQDAGVDEPPTTTGATTVRPSSPHETQAEVDAALNESMFPSPSRLNEYGSNIPSGVGVGETVRATSAPEAPSHEPQEQPQPESTAARASPSRPTGAVPESTGQGSKRPGAPRIKRLVKRQRREPEVGTDVGSKSDDDVPLSQLHLKRPPAPEPESAPTSVLVTSEAPVTSTVATPEPTNAMVVYTAADSTAAPGGSSKPASPSATPKAGPSKATPPPATPTSPFDRSKEYGVSVIQNSFLTILKESQAQVLERGGDFAGIKIVLEPLLDVMQSLTSATATLPYRTHLIRAETLFGKWQRQRDQSLQSRIGDRAKELMRIRDDTQFELQREILEKRQAIDQLMERATTLYAERRRATEAERNQQRRVDSLKAALAEAESELEATIEKNQSLIAQCTAHEAEVEAESKDLEGLSVAVSQTPVFSDDDLYRQATEEIKAAHQEDMTKIATEIRQTLGKL